MYLVSIILLLYYIGTKKKIVSFFIPHPAIVPTPLPPLLLVFGEISIFPLPGLFQTPRLFRTRE